MAEQIKTLTVYVSLPLKIYHLLYLSPKVNQFGCMQFDNQTVRVIVSNLTSNGLDFNQDKTDIHFYVSGADYRRLRLSF